MPNGRRPDAPDPSSRPTEAGAATFGKLVADVVTPSYPPGTVRLVRQITSDPARVRYDKPPVGSGSRVGSPSWVGSQDGTYQLTAPADLAKAVQLAEWGPILCGRLADPSRRAAAEKQFNALAKALFGVTAQLHNAGWRLGLSDPDNVYVLPAPDGTVEVFLPDLGFVWIGSGEVGGWEDEETRPGWLPATPPYPGLWPEPAWQQQLAAPDVLKEYHPAFRNVPDPTRLPAAVQKEDLQVAARLLAFARTGRFQLGEHDRGPQALKDALAGKFSNADEVWAKLGKNVGTEFVPLTPAGVPVRTPERTRRRWAPAAAGISLLGVAAAVVIGVTHPDWLRFGSAVTDPGQPGSTGPPPVLHDPGTASPTQPPLPASDRCKAIEDRFRSAASLAAATDATADGYDLPGRTEEEERWLTGLRRRLHLRAAEEFEGLFRGARDNAHLVRQTTDFAEALQRIVTKLPGPQQEEEKQWLREL